MRGRSLLRVIADAEDHNITVDECGILSRTISDLLDSYPHDFPDYRLEVSSPGLQHPLQPWQFFKNIGRTVEVHSAENGKPVVQRGILVTADKSEFTIQVKDKEVVFHLTDLNSVYVLPSFK